MNCLEGALDTVAFVCYHNRYEKKYKWEGFNMKIEVGMEAPDFALESHLDDRVRLSEYRGRHNVLIAFFPLAWTPV